MNQVFPFTALVRREFVTTLRKGYSFVLLGLLVGGSGFLIGTEWPVSSSIVRAGEISRNVHLTLQGLLWTSCLVLVSATAGASIIGERDRDTFEALYLTLIRPAGIVLAKVLSAAGFFLLMVVAVLPLAGTLFFLVGVDWKQMADLLVGLVFLSLSCAAVGVFTSTVSRKSSEAIAGAVVLTFLLYYLGRAVVMTLLIDLLPASSTSGLSGVLFGDRNFFNGILPSLVITVALMAISAFILRRPPKPIKVEQRKPIERSDRAALRLRRRRWPFYLLDPLKRRKPLADNWNPVFLKDLYWGPRDLSATMGRMFFISLLLFLMSIGIIIEGISAHDLAALLFGQTIFIMLIAPAVAANSITQEIELGNLEMLRLTPLTPHEIVIGKFLAGLTVAGMIVLASLFTVLPVAAWTFGGGRFFTEALPALITGYLTMAVCVALTQAGAILASALSRGSGFAAAASYLIAFIVLIGLTLLVIMIAEWLGFPNLDDHFAFFFSPLAASFDNLDRHDGAPGLYWFANVALFSLVSAGVLGLAAVVFDRRARRISERGGG